MKKNYAFVIYYNKNNKYSFNALLGAIETEESLNNIKIYFIKNKKNFITEIEHIIKEHKKVIIGVSFFTTQLWDINKIVKTLREKFGKKILLISGGPHPTGDPEGTLKMGFDIVVRGEGEETIIELLKKIFNDEDFKTVKGITFFDDNGVMKFTGKREQVDLNKYHPFAIKYEKFGPIEITRGCPFACYFCQTPRIFGARIRHRNIENICKYVEYMKNKNLLDIRFITPDAFSYGSNDGKKINLLELEELLKNVKKIIKPEGRIFFGTFPSEVRPEHVNEETIELILKYADNDNITIGAQSGSQRILDLCNRGHKVEDVYNAVKITLKAGLKANVDFIFGLPGETEEDINLTIKVIEDLTKMGAYIHTHAFIPLPQTPFAKSPPKGVNEKTKKIIGKISSKGFAFGSWQKQEKIAFKIYQYLNPKPIPK
ncbi:MAG: TIGR04013 family B12-binding domain/radical SAM domain-containing protein [candidate division WOR-3 bacterium]